MKNINDNKLVDSVHFCVDKPTQCTAECSLSIQFGTLFVCINFIMHKAKLAWGTSFVFSCIFKTRDVLHTAITIHSEAHKMENEHVDLYFVNSRNGIVLNMMKTTGSIFLRFSSDEVCLQFCSFQLPFQHIFRLYYCFQLTEMPI